MTSASICDEQLAKKLSKEYHTLNIVISTGRAKELLGRNMTVKELEELTSDKLDVYYKIYELNYANKVSSCLNGTLIGLYSYAINKVLPIYDIEKLQEDPNSSYILNNEFRNITGGLARVGGKIWSLVELSLTTFKHVRLFTPENEPRGELCKEQID
jgi:hypothetical protein